MALSHVLNIIANAGAVTAGSSSLDSQALTVGQHSITYPGGSGVPTSTTNTRGLFYMSANGGTDYGSISDGTSALYTSAGDGTQLPISSLYYVWSNVFNAANLILVIDSTSEQEQYNGNSSSVALANSGWTTLTINGTAYSRASAVYTGNAANTTWRWPASPADYNGSQNPLPANGQIATCVWT